VIFRNVTPYILHVGTKYSEDDAASVFNEVKTDAEYFSVIMLLNF
jgi:hypothetical protein